MKRSEAIEIIGDYIYHLNEEPEVCDEVSENILLQLEKAGIVIPWDQE